MNLKFEEFQKSNLNFEKLDNIRIENFNKFKTQGFPTRRQEHWKYTDLNKIINNNFEKLQIFENKKNFWRD